MIKRGDIAKALDVDPAMITRWAKRGMPCYDIDAARNWRNSNIRPRATPPSRGERQGAPAAAAAERTEANGSDYWAARTQREKAEAAIADLKLAEMAGDLVKRGEVERASFESGRLLRDMVLSVPSRVAAEVLALGSPQAVEARIRDELRKVLAELSRLSRTGMEASPQ